MAEPKRVSVQEVRSRLLKGDPLLLVCAYPNEAAFKRAALEGAISYPEIEKRLPALKMEHVIVFY